MIIQIYFLSLEFESNPLFNIKPGSETFSVDEIFKGFLPSL